MNRLRILVVFALIAVVPASTADAETTVVVTTTADLPGTICGSTCSLRQAIGAANVGGGSNTVTFAVNGVFLLSTGNELHITGSPTQTLTINGNGPASTVIDGGGLTRVLRTDAGARVTLARVTVRNGMTMGDGGGVSSAGPLIVTESVFTGNRAGLEGGAVVNDVGPATLTITTSTFSGNSAGRTGGGIRNRGTATLTNITVTDNHQTDSGGRAGGGIASGFNTILNLTSSTVSANTAAGLGGSGGIAVQGAATLDNVRIVANRAVDHGGGIGNAGRLTLTNSSVDNNVLTGTGVARDGGGITNYGELMVTSSRVSGNVAAHDGGGVANEFGAIATITASSIVGNRAANQGGGIANEFTFESSASSVNVINSVIAGNAASDGGGIFNPDGTVTLSAGAVTSNTPNNCAPPASVPGCTG